MGRHGGQLDYPSIVMNLQPVQQRIRSKALAVGI
jgi:hypothetical protein